MALTGKIALKDYIEELASKGINIILTKDIHNNGFKLDIIKGDKIQSDWVQPWIATSENWEWLMIGHIKRILEKFDNDE